MVKNARASASRVHPGSGFYSKTNRKKAISVEIPVKLPHYSHKKQLSIDSGSKINRFFFALLPLYSRRTL